MFIEEAINRVLDKEGAFFYTPNRISGGKSYLFGTAEKHVVAEELGEVSIKLEQVDQLCNKGFIGYGFITYEAGFSFEERLLKEYSKISTEPFLKFNFVSLDNVKEIKSSEINFSNVSKILSTEYSEVENFQLSIARDEYILSINSIKNEIKEGETYQVNYTTKADFKFKGNLLAFILNLFFNQTAEYIAIINDGGKLIISMSPELFFRTDETQIFAKPMKGTIQRGFNLESDSKNLNKLYLSSKDRAENIMIVDLLRNDLGRISEFNSVKVDEIYKIEKYESLFQMVSSISAKLKESKFSTIIKNIFPCGSITGAPKIRTMRIINKLEHRARGIYTGAIGMMQKNYSVFNVPIRTITINKKTFNGELGIGSGVVWDSDAELEYEETLLKGEFLTKPLHYFEILESFLIENGKAFLIEYHKRRMKQAADFFLFKFDEALFNEIVEKLCANSDSSKFYKARILLNKWGEIKSECSEIFVDDKPVKVLLSDKIINLSNKYLYFKTTNRKHYSEDSSLYIDFFDIIYQNENGFITEGSRSNIIIKKGNKLFTPSLECGLLNGTYRQYLIDQGNCIEKPITMNELLNADEIFLVNSVRKMRRVSSITKDNQLIFCK